MEVLVYLILKVCRKSAESAELGRLLEIIEKSTRYTPEYILRIARETRIPYDGV